MKSLWTAQAWSPFPSLGFIIGLQGGMETMVATLTIF